MTNSCIPLASCCTAADCAPTTQVATTTCGGGTCSVATCNAGFYDVDHTFPDGCECADLGNGKTCASPTNVGTIALGASLAKSGNLPVVGMENWFQITFAGQGGTTYHPKVALTTNPGNAFVFDVASNCSGGTQACGTETGVANFRTTWEVTSGGDPAGVGINSTPYTPTPAVGTNGTVWVRVYRAAGNPACDTFILTISN
jgi:hypothetical protein